MLKKSVLLGSTLALALAISGSAWANDQEKDNHYGDYGNDYKKVYCPAKNQWKCERKGGEFKSYGHYNFCLFKEYDVKDCEIYGKRYKVKVEESTLWKLNTKNYYCDSRERETIKSCWKKYGWKWVWAPKEECQKCLDHEDDNDDNNYGHNDDDDNNYGHNHK